mgnify:CR=1 FL=1
MKRQQKTWCCHREFFLMQTVKKNIERILFIIKKKSILLYIFCFFQITKKNYHQQSNRTIQCNSLSIKRLENLLSITFILIVF